MISANVSNYSDPILNEKTRKAYRDFANRNEYLLAVTLTFRKEVDVSQAYYYLKEFRRGIQKKAFGKNALKKIRTKSLNEVAFEVGLEDKGQHHFHLRIRPPKGIKFKDGFNLRKEVISIWYKVTGAHQIDVQVHYFKSNGESYHDYIVKCMGTSYHEYHEYFWDD